MVFAPFADVTFKDNHSMPCILKGHCLVNRDELIVLWSLDHTCAISRKLVVVRSLKLHERPIRVPALQADEDPTPLIAIMSRARRVRDHNLEFVFGAKADSEKKRVRAALRRFRETKSFSVRTR